MNITHTYLVPDYYPHFQCKAGQCRHSCCSAGWDITVTQDEYYRLENTEGSDDLHRRLDKALHLCSNCIDESHYALLSPDYNGNCPLHLSNGYCQLQAETNETLLTAACRYYPRSPKALFGHRCACANSCEKVLEMLFDRESPLTFVSKELTFELPAEMPPLKDAVSLAYPALEEELIAHLQNRQLPLSVRLSHLFRLATATDEDAFHCPDPPTSSDPFAALTALCRYTLWLYARQPDLYDICEKALSVLNIPAEVDIDTFRATAEHEAILRQAESHLETLLPDWERRAEQMLVNHLFYTSFAYVAPTGTYIERALAFLAAYALPRFLTALNMVSTLDTAGKEATFVDLNAALFRLIEHTAFDNNSVVLLKRWGIQRKADILQLTAI